MLEIIKELGGDDVEGLEDVENEDWSPANDEDDDHEHQHGDDPCHVRFLRHSLLLLLQQQTAVVSHRLH